MPFTKQGLYACRFPLAASIALLIGIVALQAINKPTSRSNTVSAFLEGDEITLESLSALSKSVRHLYLADRPLSPSEWDALAQHRQLETLSLRQMPIPPEAAQALSQLENLETLYLMQASIDWNGLLGLAKLTKLASLTINHRPVLPDATGPAMQPSAHPQEQAPADMPLLGSLQVPPNLRSLTLNYPGLGAEHIQEMLRPGTLRRLSIAGSALSIDVCSLSGVSNLEALDISRTGITTISLDQCQSLKSLTANYSLLDHALASPALRKLQQLSLEGTEVSDSVIATLENSTELQSLNLTKTQISSTAIEKIASIVNLETLILNDTSATDSIFAIASRLPKLAFLGLAGCTVSGAGLEQLETLKDFGGLDLSRTAVSDSALQPIVRLRGLSYFAAANTSVGNDTLLLLTRLTKLSELDLSGTTIDDQAIPHIAGMRALEYLNVVGSKVSAAGIKEIEKRYPELELEAS